MPFNRSAGNLIRQILNDPGVLACGLALEVAGPRSIKVMRKGSFLGLWRQAVGSFDWYPAGYNQPVHRVLTTEAVVHHIVRSANMQ